MFSANSWGQVAEHPILLALSKTDRTLSIVDPVTLKVIAKMPVGPDPHEVIASADGTRAWVSNMLNSQGHELDVLDLVNYKALPSIDTAPMVGLHGLDFRAVRSGLRHRVRSRSVGWIQRLARRSGSWGPGRTLPISFA